MTTLPLFAAHTGRHRAGTPQVTALRRPSRLRVLARRAGRALLRLWDQLGTVEVLLPPMPELPAVIPGPGLIMAARESRERVSPALAGQTREVQLADARPGVLAGADESAAPALSPSDPARGALDSDSGAALAPTVPPRQVAASGAEAAGPGVETGPASGASPALAEAGEVPDDDEWDDAARFVNTMSPAELTQARDDVEEWRHAAGLPDLVSTEYLPGGRGLMRTGITWWIRQTAADGLPRLGPTTPVPAARPYTERPLGLADLGPADAQGRSFAERVSTN